MPSVVDWYLVEVQRRIDGRMPAQEVLRVLEETQDHLLELNPASVASVEKKFGRLSVYARALLGQLREDGRTVWRQAVPTVVTLTVGFPIMIWIYSYYEDSVMLNRYSGLMPLVLLGFLVVLGFQARRLIAVPIIASVALGVIVGALILGYSYSSPRESESSFLSGVAPRNVTGGPRNWAIDRLIALKRERAYYLDTRQKGLSGTLTPELLKADYGYRTTTIRFRSSSTSPVQYETYDEYEVALSTWASQTRIPADYFEEEIARMKEFSSISEWRSVYEESLESVPGLVSANLLLGLFALTGNFVGLLFRKYIWLPRRRYA